jgi:replicative DNA helicase
MHTNDQNKPDAKRKQTRNERGGSEGLSNYVFGKIPPQALPLEEAVLGALMLDREALPMVMDILRPESFYQDAHQHIYRAIIRLFERSNPVDILTVTEELRKSGELDAVGGAYYLVELSNRVASAANVEYHARIIAQKHIQRELIRVSTTTIRDAYDDTVDVFNLLDEAEKGLFDITQKNLSRTFASMGDLSTQVLQKLEELASKADGLTGVPSGFTPLDKITSGWQPSDLIIIAARPGMGKTSLVLAMALNAARDFGKGVALFSLEMSSTQLVQRLISLESEIPGSKMRSGKLESYEWQMLQTTVERLNSVPIFIDDTAGINIFELRAKCRRLKMQQNISLVIIDYLQLMSGMSENFKSSNREQEIAGISRALKSMAKELNVPVIALSQLSRAVETRGGSKRPQLSDLRESGCLTGDTYITDPISGTTMRMDTLVKSYPNGGFYVCAMSESDQCLVPAKASRAFFSGKKRVFLLTTGSGTTIKATANHPFYTQHGWVALEHLHKGAHIAMADDTNGLSHTPANPKAIAGGEGTATAITPAVHRVLWDTVADILPMGEEDVFDITVPGLHNFVANGLVVHNSIEQDADLVSFIYRPEYYGLLDDDSGRSLKGIAEIIIAKHRHGAIDTVQLKFVDQFAKFMNLDDPMFPTPTSQQATQTVIARPSRMNDEDTPF